MTFEQKEDGTYCMALNNWRLEFTHVEEDIFKFLYYEDEEEIMSGELYGEQYKELSIKDEEARMTEEGFNKLPQNIKESLGEYNEEGRLIELPYKYEQIIYKTITLFELFYKILEAEEFANKMDV